MSHHPPISACWAEGSRWRYYGEECTDQPLEDELSNDNGLLTQVDAQNKFTGKSFEIRPTGVANVDILLPVEWGPTYPKCKNKCTVSERAIEHYSWKKVTTNVSGFILGSPTIDHYGDMIVRSFRTSSLPRTHLSQDHQSPNQGSMPADVQAKRLAGEGRVRNLGLRR